MVLIQVAQWLFDKIRELLRKWRREEESTAVSEDQRESIHRKYERREADLVGVEREIPGKMREIVRDALNTADEQTLHLLKNSDKEPVPIAAPAAKKPQRVKRKSNASKSNPKVRNA